jgi:hypothetical protein
VADILGGKLHIPIGINWIGRPAVRRFHRPVVDACDAAVRDRLGPFVRGRVEVWPAGVVRAVATQPGFDPGRRSIVVAVFDDGYGAISPNLLAEPQSETFPASRCGRLWLCGPEDGQYGRGHVAFASSDRRTLRGRSALREKRLGLLRSSPTPVS